MRLVTSAVTEAKSRETNHITKVVAKMHILLLGVVYLTWTSLRRHGAWLQKARFKCVSN